MNRRNFMKAAAVAPLLGVLGGRASETGTAAAGDGKPWCGKNHPLAGKKLPPWKPKSWTTGHMIAMCGLSSPAGPVAM